MSRATVVEPGVSDRVPSWVPVEEKRGASVMNFWTSRALLHAPKTLKCMRAQLQITGFTKASLSGKEFIKGVNWEPRQA